MLHYLSGMFHVETTEMELHHNEISLTDAQSIIDSGVVNGSDVHLVMRVCTTGKRAGSKEEATRPPINLMVTRSRRENANIVVRRDATLGLLKNEVFNAVGVPADDQNLLYVRCRYSMHNYSNIPGCTAKHDFVCS